ncbi:MAG: AI-2E family transporter, partial [Oscillospiraceae bacterium]|nr:AI-2E family transporter [Oscillospiraceae bacterium]
GMLILYAIISVIRQIIEPKIVGEQVGLPAMVTLMAMFLGVRFIGVLGIFVFPIALVIIKRLNDNGKIHLFK